jgi:hypothetical protein
LLNLLTQSESMKAKAYLLDRPTTAFINSLIDQERQILTESFSKEEASRVAATEADATRARQIEAQDHKTRKIMEFTEQKKCLDRFNKLYPDLKLNIPTSPVHSRPTTSSGDSFRPDTAGSRPATSGGRPLTADMGGLSGEGSRRSPLRPITADEKNKLHYRRTKPTFNDKRFDMTLVLGLKDRQGNSNINSNSFPSANTDSIPSKNSAIEKFRTPREQMLDSLAVPSQAEEETARRKATQRVLEANKALKALNHKSSKPNSGRFSDSRQATPLSKIGITASTGALSSRGGQQPVFLKPAKTKVKHLRDLMKTTAGVDSRLFNKGFQSNIPYDAQAERKKTVLAAAGTKEIDNLDSTTEALVNPGFFEAMGPGKIYLSESRKFHSADDRHMKQVTSVSHTHLLPTPSMSVFTI